MASSQEPRLSGEERIDAGACVIGTGMGGTAVAESLAAQGIDVLCIEAGGDEAGDEPQQEILGAPLRLRRFRAIELGGGSNLWHGVCSPLDEIDFAARRWIPDSGWPISRDELMPFYERAAEALEIAGCRHFSEDALPHDVARRARDIPFDPAVLKGKLFQFRDRPPRLRSRWKTLRAGGRIRCLLNTSALELAADESGRRIDHVIAGSGDRRLKVHARIFVICAGALETPRLLLNSRGRRKAGLGNGLVGRYLMDHPAGHFRTLRFARTVHAPLFSRLRIAPSVNLMLGLTLPPALQASEALPNNCLFIRPRLAGRRVDPDFLMSLVGVRRPSDLGLRELATLMNPHVFYRIAVQRLKAPPLYRHADLFFMTEQLPSRDSFVRLSERVRDRFGYPVIALNWNLSKADHAGFEKFARLVLDHGLRDPSYRVNDCDAFEEWPAHVASAAHFLGTARMAADAAHGVVDRNLRIFGVDNAFICDGSVFPTAGSVNPSFTIFALGLRLAAHLAPLLRS